MRCLFIHQNFPAQFVAPATVLAAREDTEVVAIGCAGARDVPGVRLVRYGVSYDNIHLAHPFSRRLESEARRAEQIMYVGSDLAAGGFVPDVVFVHCGWGESLPLRELFPAARIVTYFEWFYRGHGLDVDFDPEWPVVGLDSLVSLRMKNAATLLALTEADVAITPTEWQRSTFPAAFHDVIRVCHEGVDTSRVKPDGAAELELLNGLTLRAGDEVLTYVSRHLEPLRGFHTFMRSLPDILRRRPTVQVVIVGGDDNQYGLEPPAGLTWREVFLSEVREDLDVSRVHFLGRVAYPQFLRILQVSAVHVYLTYPFVLSWSLLEAMAAECLIVASSTAPVVEVLNDQNGVLVDFFDPAALSRAVVACLEEPARFSAMRRSARRTVVEGYERGACLDRLFRMSGLLADPASAGTQALEA